MNRNRETGHMDLGKETVSVPNSCPFRLPVLYHKPLVRYCDYNVALSYPSCLKCYLAVYKPLLTNPLPNTKPCSCVKATANTQSVHFKACVSLTHLIHALRG